MYVVSSSTIINPISASYALFSDTAQISNKSFVTTIGTNTNYNIPLIGGTGNQQILSDASNNLLYNPSTDILTVPTVAANLTGTATSASYCTSSVQNFGSVAGIQYLSSASYSYSSSNTLLSTTTLYIVI